MISQNNLNIYNEIDHDIIVKADDIQLKEVFDNFISNSIKYSINGGHVTIFAMEDNNIVTISIQDAGSGLTKENINNIFDEFYKADDSRHDLKSSGLGLSICKKIIQKHGGEIWASGIGQGKGFFEGHSIQVDGH